MKKVLVLFIVATSAFQLKAQQFFNSKPSDSLPGPFPNHLKIKPPSGLSFLNPGFNLNQPNGKSIFFDNYVSNDRMAVVVLPGFDKMQVAKLKGYDHMPVLNLGTNRPGTGPQNGLPGMPTFSGPAARN